MIAASRMISRLPFSAAVIPLLLALLLVPSLSANAQLLRKVKSKVGGAISPPTGGERESTVVTTSAGEVALGGSRAIARGIAFTGNTTQFAPGAESAIQALARALKATAGTFLIEAHTDLVGTPPDSAAAQELSDRRAFAVKAALVAQSVPVVRLFAIGLGAARPLPLAAADTAQGAGAKAREMAESAVPGAKIFGMGVRAVRQRRAAASADSTKPAAPVNARIEVARVQ